MILNKKLKPKSLLAAKIFHLFYLTGGIKYKELSGNFQIGYKYKNNRIKMSKFETLIYYIGKFYEKIILNFFINYGVYKLISLFRHKQF